MYIHGYLRASTKEQDALRAKNRMKAFVEEKGFRLASWYTENVSGASLQRPELLRLLDDAAPGDIILIEQVDRLSRLDEEGWQKLKHLIQEKHLVLTSRRAIWLLQHMLAMILPLQCLRLLTE